MSSELVAASQLAFAFHYHRDRMNAAIHAGEPKFSPITFQLARALIDSGVWTAELALVDAHLGTYPQDGGR